ARRQIALLEDGGSVTQETRLYDPDKGETRSMRSKEEAHDYRYFPCPDLLPLEIEQGWVDDIAASLPELPDEKKARFVADFGMTEYDASVLTADVESATYFEEVARGRDGKLAANWVINELFGRLKKEDHGITDSPVTAAQLGGILDLIANGDISGKIAKDLFEIVYTEGGDPAAIVDERGMKQVTDTGAIEAEVDKIIAENPAQVEKAKSNPKLAGWFVGQVMKATGGKANPAAVNQLVQQKLGI
ncbi:MAG: Asp-tRNA(Asn)/Glu-tRNA(Gln) amidotransferase GatCAB subunit B, partial [Silicimonas sp.]|nr:Asp-tRNA(Asn)/Glu-tRNA(Gln) amidotransferase GatCAB subunit B [Silicimonas sp.]NND41847.1 Asp-tRNA(Asn)/Glu-tRNA(Gln) amidotransferase GatCAB subunit B [Silicimonas sp.]